MSLDIWGPMKPVILLPPKAMSDDDIAILRANGLCVVTVDNPAAVKFMDPIPAAGSRTKIENAAIKFSRRLLAGDLFPNNRGDVCKLFVECLVRGTPLDPAGSIEEVEQRVYDEAKFEELRKLARLDAKAAREATTKAKGEAK